MSDTALGVLKACLIALLYLFLVRVVLVVARELRGTPARAGAPEPSEANPALADAASKKRAWTLAIVEPEAEQGRAFPVAAELTIGRGGGCGVALAGDTFVSTVHARAFERDGAIWVEDLGSTNGTLVNGQRIEAPTRLRRKDRLQVGGTVFEAVR